MFKRPLIPSQVRVPSLFPPRRVPPLAPWPRSAARTYAEFFAPAGGRDRPLLHLPRYPLYRPDERLRGDYGYWYLRGERYLSCQAARFMLLGGSFVTLADEAAVDLTRDLPGYWCGWYREHFAGQFGEVLRYAGPDGYRRAVTARPGLRLVSPHPFDSAHIPARRYYLDDPGLTVRLNEKGRLHDLSDRVPRFECLDAAAFERGCWRGRWPLPFVVKLCEPSGGGDGVVLCRGEGDVREARQRFRGRPVKVEQSIEEVRANYNVQLHIGPGGDLEYIGGSVQRVQCGSYAGNSIDLDWTPPAAVARVCDAAARAAAALGWYGVCGLDLLEDGEGAVWLIDPNFRLNGSTPFFLIGDSLRAKHRKPRLCTGYFCYPGTPAECFERFRREIQYGVLVPVGAHYDPRADGITRLYAAVVSDADPDLHPVLLRALAAKELRSGIGL